MQRLCLSLAILLACCCTDAVQGQSFGRWNLPSTTAQVFGYGNGAGHHAPMVRTLGCKPERVPRVAFVPCKSRVGCSACKRRNFVPLPTAVAGCTGGHCGVQAASQPWQQQWQQPLPQYPQAIQQPYLPAEQAAPAAANPQPFFLPPPMPPQPKQNLAKVSVPAPPMPTAKPASASE